MPQSLVKEHMKRPPAPPAGPISPPGRAPIIQPTDGSTPAFIGMQLSVCIARYLLVLQLSENQMEYLSNVGLRLILVSK